MRILLIGDSLSVIYPSLEKPATPGSVLAVELMKAGHHVKIVAREGRPLYNVFPAMIDQDIDSYDKVIVFLGTNDSPGFKREDVEELKDHLMPLFGLTKFIGIGPPAFNKQKLDNSSILVGDVMKRIFQDRYISSRPLTRDMLGAPYRRDDGIHFTAQGARSYGRALAARFKSWGVKTKAMQGGEGSSGGLVLAGIGLSLLYLLMK